jgi:hypothetical protein
VLVQLNPPLPLETSKGAGWAHCVIDTGRKRRCCGWSLWTKTAPAGQFRTLKSACRTTGPWDAENPKIETSSDLRPKRLRCRRRVLPCASFQGPPPPNRIIAKQRPVYQENSMAKRRSRKYSRGAANDVESEVHRYKRRTARSGRGGRVESRKQAIAIGLSKARKKGKKVPKKRA